jgi:hypothetical protein
MIQNIGILVALRCRKESCQSQSTRVIYQPASSELSWGIGLVETWACSNHPTPEDELLAVVTPLSLGSLIVDDTRDAFVGGVLCILSVAAQRCPTLTR